MRLADDLWLLPGRPRYAVNVYVIGDVLVDAAIRQSAARILRQLPVAPREHVLTHGHLDHTGSSHELCEQLELALRCGAADVEAVESGNRAGLAQRPWAMRVEHRLFAGPGHPVAGTLKEGDEVGGFTVLETPGHSPGHVAFWRDSDRTLVLGDVLFNLPTLRLPPAMFTPDPAENLRSVRRLAALEPALVCFGHGPPLRDPDRLQRFASSASV